MGICFNACHGDILCRTGPMVWSPTLWDDRSKEMNKVSYLKHEAIELLDGDSKDLNMNLRVLR